MQLSSGCPVASSQEFYYQTSVKVFQNNDTIMVWILLASPQRPSTWGAGRVSVVTKSRHNKSQSVINTSAVRALGPLSWTQAHLTPKNTSDEPLTMKSKHWRSLPARQNTVIMHLPQSHDCPP